MKGNWMVHLIWAVFILIMIAFFNAEWNELREDAVDVASDIGSQLLE